MKGETCGHNRLVRITRPPPPSPSVRSPVGSFGSFGSLARFVANVRYSLGPLTLLILVLLLRLLLVLSVGSSHRLRAQSYAFVSITKDIAHEVRRGGKPFSPDQYDRSGIFFGVRDLARHARFLSLVRERFGTGEGKGTSLLFLSHSLIDSYRQQKRD